MDTNGRSPVKKQAAAAVKAGAEAVRVVFASVHGHAQAQIVKAVQLQPVPVLVKR